MKRNPLLEIIVFVVAAWWVTSRDPAPTVALAIHRAAYQTCQQSAAFLGRLGMELEKSYRIKVTP